MLMNVIAPIAGAALEHVLPLEDQRRPQLHGIQRTVQRTLSVRIARRSFHPRQEEFDEREW
jgi:hypothetical protein